MDIGCIVCHEKARHRRGLCTVHYGQQQHAIRAGRTTDAELVANGLRLPAQRPGEAYREADHRQCAAKKAVTS